MAYVKNDRVNGLKIDIMYANNDDTYYLKFKPIKLYEDGKCVGSVEFIINDLKMSDFSISVDEFINIYENKDNEIEIKDILERLKE